MKEFKSFQLRRRIAPCLTTLDPKPPDAGSTSVAVLGEKKDDEIL
jgi:hypothetical protein